MSTWGIFLMKTMTNAHFTQVARSTLTCETTSSFDNRLLHVLPRKPEQQWRLVVKLAGRAAKFHLWLQARRQDLAAGRAKNRWRGKKTEGEATFLKYSIGCMQQPGDKREMGEHRFQMGGRAPLAPSWRRPCLVEHMELSPWLFL